MEVAVERPPVKEEKREANEEIGTLGSATPIVLESFLPTQRDPSICKQDEKLESAKAAMDEVREENGRLRALLSRIVREYQSLQTHFLDAVKLQPPVKNAASPSVAAAPAPAPNAGGADAEPELVSLRLGTSSIAHQKCEKLAASEGADDEGLSLGLGREVYGGRCTNEDSGTDEVKTDEPGEPCQRSKECRDLSAADDEDGRQQQVKKARVSVRAKCDTPTMNDGCHWRKYGQKISKGNPCPRAYYRCTIAAACPVRKQVQRCADDMSILITTYEGAHNHPLPPAAAALASATSVAASMITSGERISSSSYSQHHLPLMSTGGLFSPTAISSTATCPTVTLDLTTPHSLLSSYASTSYESRALPAAWSSGCLAYGSQPYYVRSSPFGHLGVSGVGESIARPIGHEQLHQSYLQKASSLAGGEATTTATDTIAKVITSDPSFQSVLAAAITSYIGCNAAQR